MEKKKDCPVSKNSMRIEIDGKLHYVVYIEYNGKIPHDVKTITYIGTAEDPYWRLYHWDAFANDGDDKDIRLYNSGSGGCEVDICGPQWADGYIGTYWLAKGIEFKTPAKNGQKIHMPFRIRGYHGSSTNPFKIGWITDSEEYCLRCDHYSTDICWTHKYEDEEDNYTLKYKDDNTYAE